MRKSAALSHYNHLAPLFVCFLPILVTIRWLVRRVGVIIVFDSCNNGGGGVGDSVVFTCPAPIIPYTPPGYELNLNR